MHSVEIIDIFDLGRGHLNCIKYVSLRVRAFRMQPSVSSSSEGSGETTTYSITMYLMSRTEAGFDSAVR
jgi:hypothetical protein